MQFETRKNKCDIVVDGERELRKEKRERLETGIKKLREMVDKLGRHMKITRRKKYLKQKLFAWR